LTQRPEPTISYIPISEIETARGGAQIYNLTRRQRLLYEKRAYENNDIWAAKTLVEYHEMVTRDEKQYHHWLRVVARLEKIQREKAKESHGRSKRE
jgi:hypothetical protein